MLREGKKEGREAGREGGRKERKRKRGREGLSHHLHRLFVRIKQDVMNVLVKFKVICTCKLLLITELCFCTLQKASCGILQ